MSKSGLSVIALGAIDKREVYDEERNGRMVHSLESVNFLKVARDKNSINNILFECAGATNVLSVQSEFSKNDA